MAGRFIFFQYSKRLFLVLVALVIFIVSFAQNPIVTENALPGNPVSEWGVPDFRDNRIAGFSTKMSLNRGETVRFKIDVQGGANYTLKIYRIGYYGGNGARLKHNLGTLTGTIQPAGISDPATGMLDCGNWSESASWIIPASAVSGFYIAKLERSGGGSNHIAFIVRNDASNSDLYLQFPDATWQAYNGYGGNSMYDGNTAGFPSGHAVKVSYNRPFFPYNSLFNTDGREADWYMNAEYPMIRWLERNGYDVTYTSSNDVDNNGGRLLNHKVFISLGHDEYWSKKQRDNVEAARNAGVNLAFFSGNEVYWKTRWESNNGSEDRTLVCYKEGLWADGSLAERVCGNKCDNSSLEWTGLWRTGEDYDAGQPENALTGQISWVEFPAEIGVPSFYKKLRFWRNTSIPNLTTGQTAFLGANTLGYEWDYEQPQYAADYPSGRITMSSRTVNNVTHKLSLYRHSSGALVFSAGTVQWSWGLDGLHWGGTTTVSPEMQQATVNLFADMGIQPGALQTGLIPATKSTDFTPPVSTILSPANGSSTPAGAAITISGTANEGGGGVVAGVEISADGGVTWNQADINAADASITWSYTWFPLIEGTTTIKTRGFDDNGNKENPGAGINVTVTPAVCPCSIFQPASVPARPLNNDGQAIELGMKFRSTQNGFITGIRYYKGLGTTGTHIGSLWTSTGTRLATATFAGESASGWQQVLFSSAVAITAGVTYVASYFSPSGDYAVSNPFFTQAVVNSSLRALANGEDGPNGLSKYSATSTFPTDGFQSSNYWVDVVFTRSSGNLSPVVTTQPSAQTVCSGNNARFYSAASGWPAPTVQWQSSSTYGILWTNINGATNNTLNFATTTWDNNKRYRAVWKNNEGVINSNSVTLTVNAIPATPAVTVVNNCGNSVLTARSFAGSLFWSNGATTSFITVTTAGTCTAKQTIKGCISLPGIGTASPKAIPVLSSSLKTILNSGASFIYIPTSTVAGTTFTWSRAAVKGISNPAATGSGNIVGALINTTNSPVNVTYVYTLRANGCTKTQNVVITVNPSQATACLITTSIVSSFNSTPIPAGRYIWFNSSFSPGSFGKLKKKEPVTFYVTNSWINFTANGRQYTLTVPNSRIRFDENVVSASTKFINNVWETVVPLNFDNDVFMGGLSYLIPSGLPGNISNVKWTADINLGNADLSLTWRWSAAVYTRFAGNAGLHVKPISDKKQNPYPNSNEAGSPENFKDFVVAGATGQVKDKNDYKVSYSKKNKVACTDDHNDDGDNDDDDDEDEDKDRSSGKTSRRLIPQLPSLSVKQFSNETLDVKVMPNPSSSYFDLVIGSKSENPVTVRILNIFGRVLEKHEKIASKTVLRLGQEWTNGVYFAVVIQGDQQKIVKIIKVN